MLTWAFKPADAAMRLKCKSMGIITNLVNKQKSRSLNSMVKKQS